MQLPEQQHYIYTFQVRGGANTLHALFPITLTKPYRLSYKIPSQHYIRAEYIPKSINRKPTKHRSIDRSIDQNQICQVQTRNAKSHREILIKGFMPPRAEYNKIPLFTKFTSAFAAFF